MPFDSRRPRGFGLALFLALALLAFAPNLARADPAESGAPNVLLILADDLGYGDLGAYNPESKAPTPNLDRLAAEGLRFTDAHAAGSFCIPSRYGLLTGRYPWRSQVRRKSSGGYAGSLIERDRSTIASFLRAAGYHTAMVGKWHLGFGPPEEDVDFSKPISFGPRELGFDSFFGLPASLDIEPYVYIEDDHITEPLDRDIEASETPNARWASGRFWRAGKTTKSFQHEETLETLISKAIERVKSESERMAFERDDARPFFLYLALTAPHTPWLPTAEFRGKSHAGEYGDFVMQVDAAVGRLLDALDEGGQRKRTLVIFASDNGAFWVREEIAEFDHRANGPLRGQKGDIWEGGHRIPFLVRWPGYTNPGTTSDQLLSFVDLFATFAAIIGEKLPEGAAEDSVNQLPAILAARDAAPGETPDGKPDEPAAMTRTELVHQAGPGFALRDGQWKYIDFLGSGGFTEPKRVEPGDDGVKGQLYDLEADPDESENLYATRPDLVEKLARKLELARRGVREASGTAASK